MMQSAKVITFNRITIDTIQPAFTTGSFLLRSFISSLLLRSFISSLRAVVGLEVPTVRELSREREKRETTKKEHTSSDLSSAYTCQQETPHHVPN